MDISTVHCGRWTDQCWLEPAYDLDRCEHARSRMDHIVYDSLHHRSGAAHFRYLPDTHEYSLSRFNQYLELLMATIACC
jgi:hypothetical protein